MSEPPVAVASHLIILAQAGRFDRPYVTSERILMLRPVAQEMLQPGLTAATVTALRASKHLLRTTDWYVSADLVEEVLVRVGE